MFEVVEVSGGSFRPAAAAAVPLPRGHHGDSLAEVCLVYCLTTSRAFRGTSLEPYPNVRAYLARIGARPAYQRAMAKAEPGTKPGSAHCAAWGRTARAAAEGYRAGQKRSVFGPHSRAALTRSLQALEASQVWNRDAQCLGVPQIEHALRVLDRAGLVRRGRSAHRSRSAAPQRRPIAQGRPDDPSHCRVGGSRRTRKHGEAVKPVPQVLELVDGHAEVAIELAEHLLRSRA